MNGIIGLATVQPDIILNKPASVTMDVADQLLVLKTDNTLAKTRFDTIVNSTSSTLPVADSTKNGMLRQVSGRSTDYVDGTNSCQPFPVIIPSGVLVDFAGPNIPPGWLLCDGASYLQSLYPALFAAIAGTYGSDATHFNVPDFTGKIAAGAGGSFGALAASGGSPSAALALGNLPSHSHPISDVTHSHSATASDSGHLHTYIWPSVGGSQWAASPGAWGQGTSNTSTGYANVNVSVAVSLSGINTTQAVGSGNNFSILPPFLTIFKIIKI